MSLYRICWLLSLCSIGVLTGCSPVSTVTVDLTSNVDYLRVEPVTIIDKTDAELTYYVDRPDQSGRYPLILMVDGSNCRGWRAIGLEKWFQPDANAPIPYARVFVEKRGVPMDSWGDDTCSETFLKTFTIDKRVEDHLRVLQHLRTQADWWDGTLYIAGWSDGGDIAAQLTAYYPNVQRSVLGAMGGGTTMFEQFRDQFICPENRFEEASERASCIADLSAEFETMKDNPTWTETWSGHANTHRVWTTRLDTRLTNLLKDVRTPILVVHGALDLNNVPVDSARTLVKALQDTGQTTLAYWEVPGMRHTPSSLPTDQDDALRAAMRDWLLVGDSVSMPIFTPAQSAPSSLDVDDQPR